MKYTVSNTIDAPLDLVMEKFTDPDGVKHWMEGFQKYERLKGEGHNVGTETDFYFIHRGKEMKIHETVLEEDLPRQIKFAYRSSMGYNEVEMIFEELSENSVKQINNSFFKFKGLMKLMGFIFKGMFKKQSLKYMNAFKAYCEKGA